MDGYSKPLSQESRLETSTCVVERSAAPAQKPPTKTSKAVTIAVNTAIRRLLDFL